MWAQAKNRAYPALTRMWVRTKTCYNQRRGACPNHEAARRIFEILRGFAGTSHNGPAHARAIPRLAGATGSFRMVRGAARRIPADGCRSGAGEFAFQRRAKPRYHAPLSCAENWHRLEQLHLPSVLVILLDAVRARLCVAGPNFQRQGLGLG